MSASLMFPAKSMFYAPNMSEAPHSCPRSSALMFSKLNQQLGQNGRVRCESSHTTYGRANMKSWPVLPYVWASPNARAPPHQGHCQSDDGSPAPSTAPGCRRPPPRPSTSVKGRPSWYPRLWPCLQQRQAHRFHPSSPSTSAARQVGPSGMRVAGFFTARPSSAPRVLRVVACAISALTAGLMKPGRS